jgi:hypothetical protein
MSWSVDMLTRQGKEGDEEMHDNLEDHGNICTRQILSQ